MLQSARQSTIITSHLYRFRVGVPDQFRTGHKDDERRPLLAEILGLLDGEAAELPHASVFWNIRARRFPLEMAFRNSEDALLKTVVLETSVDIAPIPRVSSSSSSPLCKIAFLIPVPQVQKFDGFHVIWIIFLCIYHRSLRSWAAHSARSGFRQ